MTKCQLKNYYFFYKNCNLALSDISFGGYDAEKII